RLRPGALDAEDRHEGRLPRRRVLAHRLAGDAGRALDIEQIVGDLKGEAEIMRIGAQSKTQLLRRLAENGARLAGKGDQRAGLQALQSGDGADVEIGALLGEK